MPARFPPDRVAGLLLVLALHAAALYGLWSQRLIPSPQEATTLFVDFVAPPAHEKEEEETKPPPRKPMERHQPAEKPHPRQLVAETPVTAPTDYVAPPPPPPPQPAPEPEPAIQAPPMPLPAGPVAISSELAIVCPERAAPVYPLQSRRFGETGIVVLRVELSETGQVATAAVDRSSGHARLDEAALAAVRKWRCTPASRDGQPVRAVALQPFRFVLQGD